MASNRNPSLNKRYFISKSHLRPDDYEEYWIRYKSERVSQKQFGNTPKLFAVFSLFYMALILMAPILAGVTDPLFIVCLLTMAMLILFYCITRMSEYFLRYLYPTHIQLSDEGIRFHWFRNWMRESSSDLISWESVEYVTSSDKKVSQTLSVDIEFHINPDKISDSDKFKFGLMSPNMGAGWVSCDSPVIKVNIDGIASSDDRKKLQMALAKYIPPYKIEPKVADDLNMYIKFDSYTDLWLETLSSSKERSLDTVLKQGQILGSNSYKILSHIGSGGEALVYKAETLKPIEIILGLDKERENATLIDMSDLTVIEDKLSNVSELSPIVVLKEFVLPTHAGVNARQRVLENIREEAILWRKLRHPNIVRLLDFFAEDKRAYLVLEYVEGNSLKEFGKNFEYDETKLVEFAITMCDILIYLHRKNPPIIHRDFTPDNLILDNSGSLKLTDFNIALQLEANTTRKIAGKHFYIPPEQFRGEATIQSDIYAFGCTLFYLITGSEPEALSQSCPIELNKKVSPELNRITMKCTELEIESRFNTIEAVKNDLQQLI